MKPIAFYNLAVASAPAAVSEEEHRTVVSRLYYGLHHEACCRYFRVNPNASHLKFSNRHPELSRRFNDPTNPTAVHISNCLRDLKNLRGLADYDLSRLRVRNRTLTSQQLMLEAIVRARQLLRHLEVYSPGEAADGCLCFVR